MSTNVTALNPAVTASAVTQDVKPKVQERIPLDSFKLVVKINNSKRLSDGQKGMLIQTVALVDSQAKGSMRKKMLADIGAVALFMEQFSSAAPKAEHSKPAPAPAVRKYVEAVKSPPPPKKVEQVVADLPKQLKVEPSVHEIVQSIPRSEVAEIFERNVAEDIAALNRPSEYEAPQIREVAVEDVVELSPQAREVEEVPLPGSGGGEEVALPGSGSAEFEAAPVPGSGEYVEERESEEEEPEEREEREHEEVALPGSGSSDENLHQKPVYA